MHIVEDYNVTDFLHGNELIFTTGIVQKELDCLMEFVISLHAKKISGLVVNLGPYISFIPQEVIAYCEAQGFPLFTVPWEVRLVDVTYDLCHRIVSSEEIEMSLASALKNAIFLPANEESYKPVLERRGFHADASYCVIAVKLAADAQLPGDKDLRELKFHAHGLKNPMADSAHFIMKEL